MGSPGGVDATKNLHTRFEKISERESHGLTVALYSASHQLMLRNAEHDASIRATRVALAIERMRLDNGSELPASLAALVPDYLAAVPGDPLDDHPIRFRRLPKGYVVYSVGRNREDDGGTRQPASETNKHPLDRTFLVEK